MAHNNPEEQSISTAVNLFAGGGGLTVGLKRAGFKVVGAVEPEPSAFATYKANHPEVQVFKQDIRTIKGQELLALSDSGGVDLIAGCPPCQGFSSLTTKHRRDDPRNGLILEMSRLVNEIRPTAVMMENVPGITKRGRHLLGRFLEDLDLFGYKISWNILQVADYGVPQTRRRFVLLAGLGFSISMPEPTHSKNGSTGLPPWRTIRDVIKDMPEPITLKKAIELGGPQRFGWHVIRNMNLTNKLRLKYSQPGKVRSQLPDDIRPNCHKGIDEGFANVYGRMSWDQPSVTITGGFTTLSKGRFGHPEKDRTISVREAAILQTFPPDYLFDTPYMEYACNIIGNALPCDFAEALASKVREALWNYYGSMAQTN